MAITKLISPTTPNPVSVGDGGDWDLAMAQLTAMKVVMGGQQMILTEWTNTTGEPKLAQGSYLQHRGSVYVVDTADYAITAPTTDGTWFLKIAESGNTLVVSWLVSSAGYTWNASFNGLYHSDESQILPYQLVKAGATLTKRKITNLMQGSGFVTVDYLGKIDSLTVLGAISGASLDTGQGANELYPMNQGVETTDSPTFVTVNATEVVTTNGPNKPIDNNDASMPSVGIGGFSYAVSIASTEGTYPTITIGSGGTWVYIADESRATTFVLRVGKIAGGSSIKGRYQGSSGSPTSLYVIAWRIA